MKRVMKARFIYQVGTDAELVMVWDAHGQCLPTQRYHRAFKDVDFKLTKTFNVSNPPPEHSPTHCQRCNAPVPTPRPVAGLTRPRLFNTVSGKPSPGDVFQANWYDCEERGRCVHGWTNCNGTHLFAICPNGKQWDLDSRSPLCTMPRDTKHRCWVRHGGIQQLHVDKKGLTCGAPESIDMGGYQGFLRYGKFTYM